MPFCSSCGEPVLVSKKCEKCGITNVGSNVPEMKPLPQIVHQCAGCFNAIATIEMIQAIGKNYHRECFICTYCKGPMSGGYKEKDGKVYCKNDFSKLFGNTCSRCLQSLTETGTTDNRGNSFHLKCFTCQLCNKTLGTEYYFSEGLHLCPNCFTEGKKQKMDNASKENCFFCHKQIEGKFVEEEGRYFHQNCFSKYITKM